MNNLAIWSQWPNTISLIAQKHFTILLQAQRVALQLTERVAQRGEEKKRKANKMTLNG